MIFYIYPAMTSGSALWRETQANVPVSDGYFTVMLGSETRLSTATFSDPIRYLQIRITDGGGGRLYRHVSNLRPFPTPCKRPMPGHSKATARGR